MDNTWTTQDRRSLITATGIAFERRLWRPRRMSGRPQAYDSEDGVRSDIGSRGGVMSFVVEEHPGGIGHRVTAQATRVLAQHTNVGGRATGNDDWSRSLRHANIITNWLY